MKRLKVLDIYGHAVIDCLVDVKGDDFRFDYEWGILIHVIRIELVEEESVEEEGGVL